MKKIKDRPITPILLAQLAEQERRIKECGIFAKSRHLRPLGSNYGTLYSCRAERCLQPLKITNKPIKPTQNI